MLLELAVGDAYGAGFEYVDRDFIERHNDLSRYVKHPRHAIRPGAYTDDTQMSLAIAEALVSGQAWTRESLAESFVRTFKRDPRAGYAASFYDFLRRVQDGRQFLAEIRPESDKSGAAMRAAPLGVLPTVREVIEKCTLQAALTHNTPDGIRAAVAAALTAHYFVYGLGPRKDLGLFLESHVEGDWARTWTGKVKTKGWMSVHAAVTALASRESLSGLLRTCIAFSGDVDTVAAIALGAASCSQQFCQDLPEALLFGLESGPYGRDYLIELDRTLLALAGR